MQTDTVRQQQTARRLRVLKVSLANQVLSRVCLFEIAYGALLGTAAVCALLEILIAFIPPKLMLKIFPPIVTGPTVMVSSDRRV